MLLSATMTRFLLLKIQLLSLRKKLIDSIGGRKVHVSLACRLGGVSFFPSILISVILGILFLDYFSVEEYNTQMTVNQLLLGVVSIFILYLMGIYDDVTSLHFREKFIFQFFAALLIIVSGVYIDDFYGLFYIHGIPFYLAWIISIIYIVGVTNAFNLIDGIDGLAALLAIIALSAYGTLFFLSNHAICALICFASVGTLFPFLICNVFGIRRGIRSKIFMGDCGALVIGFIISVMSIILWQTSQINCSKLGNMGICAIVSYSVLIIPCFDVVRIIIRRFRMGKAFFLPDANHIHHKFLALGFTARQALVQIACIQVFFLFLNIFLYHYISFGHIMLLDIAIWILLHMAISKKIRIIKNKTQKIAQQ